MNLRPHGPPMTLGNMRVPRPCQLSPFTEGAMR